MWHPLERTLWQNGFLGLMSRVIFRFLWLRIRIIPDRERLWRAVNKLDHIYKPGTPRAGKLKPSFFRDKRGLSFDLARFSTPEGSRVGHADTPYPAGSGLVEFSAADVRAAGSDVHHKPLRLPKKNYAHAQLATVLGAAGEEHLSKVTRFTIDQRLTA